MNIITHMSVHVTNNCVINSMNSAKNSSTCSLTTDVIEKIREFKIFNIDDCYHHSKVLLVNMIDELLLLS